MLSFWCIIIAITLAALGMVIYPLVKPRRIELTQSSPSIRTALCLIILLPIFTITFYQHWGSHAKVSEKLMAMRQAKKVQQQMAAFGSRQNIIVVLRHKLERLPQGVNTAKGWYILGKLYFNEKNLKESMRAFQLAMQQNPQEPDYIFHFVSTKFLLNHHLDRKDQQRLQQLLTTASYHVNAVNLLALNAYQEKKYQHAIDYWEGLLKYYPPGSTDSTALLDMISQAQAHIPSQTTSNVVRKITVTIDIAPALKYKLEKHNVLFVYAREANGSKIPVAVARRLVDRFPLILTLDNQQSMLSGRSLNDVNRVTIEARISKQGNAMPAPGDLKGSSEIIELETVRHIYLFLNEQV